MRRRARFSASAPDKRLMVGDGARAQEDQTYAERWGAMGAVHAVDPREAGVGPRQDLAPAPGDRRRGPARLALRATQPRGVRGGVRVGRARAARARWPGIDLRGAVSR